MEVFMLKTSNKFLTVLLCIVLTLWQLPQVILGFIMLLVFRNKTTYTNPYNKITVWNINCHHAFGNACFSTGPFIITCNDKVSDEILKHETGHSQQSIFLGLLYHIVVSIPSICLFWYKKLKNKDKEWYYAHYPEGWANRLGGVNVEDNK